MNDKNNRRNEAMAVAFVGIAAATIECAKLALSFLPNVEVVTLLVALFGYVFGWLGVCAAFVFVCIEPLIYGFNTWVILYFLYWPALAILFMMLKKIGVKGRIPLSLVAVGSTVLFGMLSSFIDTVFYLGINEAFFRNLVLYYARGVVFYIVQITSNAVLFPLLFKFLAQKLEVIKRRMLLR